MTANVPMSITRHRISIDGPGSLVLWIFYLLFVGVVIGMVATFGEIRTSGWEKATQLPRWYAGAIGVYLTSMYLPVYIAHGRTRREFTREAPAAILGLSGILAALMAAGFAVEAVAYWMAGWPQTLSSTHLFSSPTNFGMILVEHWLAFLVWMVAGSFLGAAFYREPGLGLLLIPVALLSVVLMEGALGGNGSISAVPVAALFDFVPGGSSAVRALVTSFALALGGYAITYRLVRDLPMRSRPA